MALDDPEQLLEIHRLGQDRGLPAIPSFSITELVASSRSGLSLIIRVK
jgi:hypothetical protein